MMTTTQKNGEISGRKQHFESLRGMLEKNKQQLAMALPRHMSADRLLRVTLTAVLQTPALMECSKESIIGCVLQCAGLGLEPGALGQAYLVPFFNKKKGYKEAQFIVGYKGMVDLARRSGNISTINARIVHKKDFFDFEYGLSPKLTHRPCQDSDAGEMIAVYAVATLRDGGVQSEVMWRSEVNKIRERSKASDSGPWVTDYEEMAKKTVLRRLCKLLPVSVECQAAIAKDEQHDAGLPQQNAIDASIDLPQLGDEEAAANAAPTLDSLADTETPDEAHDEAAAGGRLFGDSGQ